MNSFQLKTLKKFVLNKKYQGDLMGKYSFELEWPMISKHNFRFKLLKSPEFNLCGYDWEVKVFPLGIDDSSEYMSVHLVNLSYVDIFASYSLIIKNQRDSDKSYIWKEEEEVIIFNKFGSGDNEWGNDEFISLSELFEGSDFTLNNKMIFEVEIEVFGREDLIDNTSIKSLEKVKLNDTKDLISLANDELSDVIKKLPVGKDVDADRSNEDNIIKYRTTTKK